MKLHTDILKAIKEKKTLEEVNEIMDIVDIYGSVKKFEKVVGKLNEEDKKQVISFNRIVANYIAMKKVVS